MISFPAEVFQLYAERFCEYPLLVHDDAGKILWHNSPFLKYVGAEGALGGEQVEKWCELISSEEDMIERDENAGISVYLFTCRAVAAAANIHRATHGHRMVLGRMHYLFFDIKREKGLDIVEQISQVNVDVSSLARQVSRQNRQLSDEASRDQLTGLLNRRGLAPHIRSLADSRCSDGEGGFALIMADIDNFKLINDTFGHDRGDDVLKILAGVFTGALRRDDLVARFGGEEFLIIIPCTRKEDAGLTAEKIRAAVEQAPAGIGRPVTISAGIALHQPGEKFEATLKKADEALYEAKRLGRNRCVHA